GTQAMTIYKPLSRLAGQAAEVAVRLAQRRPVIAKAELDNGRINVPSILLDVIAVTKDNIMETVVKDGFQRAEQIFQGRGITPTGVGSGTTSPARWPPRP